MDGQDESKKDHLPLQGVVLCCTAILQEQRYHMSQIAQEMGAIMKLDLTSDITHLIVGDIDTPKYKYTAKERLDIKVLQPSWLNAVRDSWIKGGEVDTALLEREHRLPTFLGLNICVTGFDDPQQRGELQDAIIGNGAAYHGDLTKTVSHLVAKAPAGKKYQYAKEWGLRIVSVEWLQDSLRRGMALEETLYDPLLPVEERGVGAVTAKSPRPGKRMRQDTQVAEVGRRKLRRVASTRLESQNDDLWADLGKDGSEVRGRDEENAKIKVEEDTPNNEHIVIAGLPSTTAGQQTTAITPTAPKQIQTFNPTGDPDTGQLAYVCGFDSRKTEILRKFLSANGAVTLSQTEYESNAGECTVIVPHDLLVEELKHLRGDIVTDMWIEKCLHSKVLVSRAAPLCTPFWKGPIEGFESITICPSSFTGIDLLHFSKAVKLMGAKYDETLRPETSILISNGAANAEKLKYALEHFIPVVSPYWLWNCITESKMLPYTDYVVAGAINRAAALGINHTTNKKQPMRRSQKPRQLELHSAPSSRETDARPHPATDSQPPQTHSTIPTQPLRQLPGQPNSSPRKAPTASTRAATPDHHETGIPHYDGVDENDSFVTVAPLHQISPHSRSSKSPQKSPRKSHSQPSPGRRSSLSPLKNPLEPPSPSQNTRVRAAVATLRAVQLKAAVVASTRDGAVALIEHNAATSRAGGGRDFLQRRHRPLGRAASNPSSLSGPPLSRPSSAGTTTAAGEQQGITTAAPLLSPPVFIHESEEDTERTPLLKPQPIWQPSQVLGYEAPEEAKALREKLMKMGKGTGRASEKGGVNGDGVGNVADEEEEDGDVERGLKRVERIGMVVDEGGFAGAGLGGDGGRRVGRRRRG